MADTEKSVKIEEGDPQSVQDLTGFVPFALHQVILFFNLILGIYVLLILLTNRSFVAVAIAYTILPIVLGDPFRSLHKRFT